ncbi:MAG: nitrogen fixation negative regulator NifL [Rhodocyclaceae bacterium]|nr:nitrogen fixation negative regulator NifL [Rhodocyclaceae bacterium]
MNNVAELEVLAPVFREALTQADIAISITDTEANILYVNPAFERVTGYAAAEAIGRNQSMLSAKATPKALYAEMWAKITAGIPWRGQLVNRRKDGVEYLADLLITPVLNEKGLIGYYLGIHRDITLEYRLQRQVSNQKALIESVIDAAPLAIALLDGEDCVVLDNHEYKKLMSDLGMVEPAALILDAVRADLGHGLGPARDGALAFVEREIRVDPPGNRPVRWFACTGAWVKSVDEGTEAFFSSCDSLFLLLLVRDITHQRAQQEKARIAALQAQMAEENRIGALRESLLAAIFQIEGPLNVLASVLAMQQRRGESNPATAALAEAHAVGKMTIELMRRAVPAPTMEAPSTLNLNEVLRDVLDLSTQRLLVAGITVSWKPHAVLPTIVGQPVRLRTLFKALIDNAIEAMNVKGWAKRELTVATGVLEDSIEAIVEDRGPGVPADCQLRVFEPFFSTKPRHAGTGLAMAQQIVADHGGTLFLESVPEGGCRARVVLPRVASHRGA